MMTEDLVDKKECSRLLGGKSIGPTQLNEIESTLPDGRVLCFTGCIGPNEKAIANSGSLFCQLCSIAKENGDS